jgi:hypothetical protein
LPLYKVPSKSIAKAGIFHRLLFKLLWVHRKYKAMAGMNLQWEISTVHTQPLGHLQRNLSVAPAEVKREQVRRATRAVSHSELIDTMLSRPGGGGQQALRRMSLTGL